MWPGSRSTRPIAHDHHHGVGCAEPAQFPQLRIEPVEDRIGVSQTTDQEAPHHRAAARRCFNTLFGQQQNPCLDLAEMTLFHGW